MLESLQKEQEFTNSMHMSREEFYGRIVKTVFS